MSDIPAVLGVPSASHWWQNRALQRFLHHRLACTGVIIILLMTLACLIGPSLLPFNDLHIDLRHRFAPPFSGWHLLGSDPLGRDTLARLLMAGRISLLVGFSSMALSIAFGAVIGIIAGYYGGKINIILMRIVDAFLSFPGVFLLLALAAFLKPSPVMITVIIAVTSWMEVARIVET